ncbi:hypothetical protein F2Q69_00049437 [Brassica cretica]|uniref:Uncharacterized protein n=1 Tax=Brassica cretica TaxID=69181 RepID=A0A8S9PUW1_BRACR|nr:hypothetical protein F2Q69_00049437 [Brassica cretica]
MSLYQVLEYHMEFLETFGCIWSSKESDLARATPRCRSRLHRSEARERPYSDVPERHHKVAPAGSDVTGATQRGRLRRATQSDVSQRPLQVAPETWSNYWRIERGSELPQQRHEVTPAGATRSERLVQVARIFGVRSSRVALGATSRSDHVRSLAFSVDQSDVSQRPREVARVFCRSERRLAATT